MSKSRTKSGCFTCRKRKKKCDERFPVCSGCSRNFLHCSWPEKRGAALPRNYEIKAATSPSQLPQPDPEDPSEYPIPSHMCFVFELDSYKHQDRKMAPRFDILTVARQPYGPQRVCAQLPHCALLLQHRQAALAVRILPTQLQLHRARGSALRVRLARRATARASAGVARDAREARGRENHKAARPGETQNDAHVDGHPDARDPDPAPGPHAGPVPDAAEPCRVQGALLCAGDSLLEARGRRHRGGQPCGTVLPRAAAGRARRAVGQLAHAAAVPATDRRLRGPQNGAP